MRAELRALAKLATPIAAARVGFVLLGVVDTAVVGRLGQTDLGAVGLGNSLFFTVVLFGAGIIMGIDPLVTQALGAGEPDRARAGMWQGIWLAVAISVPLVALTWVSPALLEPMGIEPAAAVKAAEYLRARLWGLPPFFVFAALRAYLQALGRTGSLVVAAVVANLLNLPLNWLLVFGDAGLVRLGLPAVGMPALGVAGAGYTSAVVAALQLVIVVVAVRGVPVGVPFRRMPSMSQLSRAFHLGAPVGLQQLAEVGVFALSGLLMGRISTLAVASHQVAMTLASATFMVPLGVAAAATVRVGRAVGAGDRDGTKRAGYASFLLGGSFMAICGLMLWLLPEQLAAILTDKPAIIDAAVPLLVIAAMFQVSDGLQVVGAGVLRGMGDTRMALYLNLAGHYGCGVPLGIALAFWAGWGAAGLWWGMLIGLTLVALALMLRFARLSARGVERV